jgi:RIO kinase 1
LRDVDNLHRFVRRFAPGHGLAPYAEEMWSLYESNRLTPDTILRGTYRGSTKKVDTDAVLALVREADEDERRRRGGRGRGSAGGVKAAPAGLRPPAPEEASVGSGAPFRRRRIEVIVNPSLRPGARSSPRPGARPSPKPSAERAFPQRGRAPAQPQPQAAASSAVSQRRAPPVAAGTGAAAASTPRNRRRRRRRGGGGSDGSSSSRSA